MTQDQKVRALGRGLSSLLGPELSDQTPAHDKVVKLDIHAVCPGKYQPRQHFDAENLESLVQSIKQKGIIQPILVRPIKQGLTSYEIIAGERRWQAAKKALLREIPVIIREMSDSEALETALIENIQRHDLSPLEEADGYKRLMDEFNYTQDALAQALGKSRSHIANQLRMLNLPSAVKKYIESGQLSAGHAKAIAGRDNSEDLAHQVVELGLSVRQTENLIQKNNLSRADKNISVSEQNADITSIQQMLMEHLQLNVALVMDHKEQRLIIDFKTLDELEKIIAKLTS